MQLIFKITAAVLVLFALTGSAAAVFGGNYECVNSESGYSVILEGHTKHSMAYVDYAGNETYDTAADNEDNDFKNKKALQNNGRTFRNDAEKTYKEQQRSVVKKQKEAQKTAEKCAKTAEKTGKLRD
ncbi:MAG: hypothetical protein LUD77_03960 [Clostridiales bacterium]|nr:hypothetical protein [Clostridiales bacterium]